MSLWRQELATLEEFNRRIAEATTEEEKMKVYEEKAEWARGLK